MTWTVIEGDAKTRLAEMEPESVQCAVTSPPYYSLRDYGVEGQIGLEASPGEYVAALVAVFAEVRRVLAADGTVWLNLGDSYAASGGGRQTHNGFTDDARWNRRGAWRHAKGYKRKDLLGIPWMVAFALRDDGWYLRSDIVWAKRNVMPESITDRPTRAHEFVFLLSKSERYFYDHLAVREPLATGSAARYDRPFGGPKLEALIADGHAATVMGNRPAPDARNLRDVWWLGTEPFPQAHFAVYPKALVEPCVKAGSRLGDTVLDPFCGSGTTGVVALRLGRSFVGIELSATYAAMARNRIADDAPLFNTAEVPTP